LLSYLLFEQLLRIFVHGLVFMQVLNKKMTSQATASAKLVRRHFLVGSFLFGVVQLLGSCFSVTMF
jgi:hypothetical protein